MKPSFAGVAGLCLVALAFTNSAKAQNPAATYAKMSDKDKAEVRDTAYKICVTNVINSLAENGDWIRAQSLKEGCVCQINRQIQGLMSDDCPRGLRLSNEQWQKCFTKVD